MLSPVSGLSDADLAAIADLERRVTDHDGGRLKLEWGVLRERSGTQVDDLIWRDGARAAGFLGFYSFGSADLELTGMVDPPARRAGVATALLDAAIPIARQRGFADALLVVPRSSAAGRAFALARGGVLEHSEHFMSLGDTPTADPLDPRLTLRPATAADAGEVGRLLEAGFGSGRSDPAELFDPDRSAERTLLIERDGLNIGTARVARDGPTAGIYGLVVDPPHQGKGVGRDVLNRLCRQLRDDGVEQVTLEVEVNNEHALGLYLSVGFAPRTTEDYYRVGLGPIG